MDDRKDFQNTVADEILQMESNEALQHATKKWFEISTSANYSYHFSWMGLPIIQFPQDIIAMQELIWEIKPDCIIETGVARGGSLIFYAGMMKMMDIAGKVIGVDIDIRPHNRESIENHPLAQYIDLVQGSSIDEATVVQVKKLAQNAQKVLVVLDSMHSHSHVLRELELYTPFVTKGSYCVVFDTVIEDMPQGYYKDRPWDVGNNAKTAVWEFLKSNDRFEINHSIHNKLQITVAPDGYLKCIKD